MDLRLGNQLICLPSSRSHLIGKFSAARIGRAALGRVSRSRIGQSTSSHLVKIELYSEMAFQKGANFHPTANKWPDLIQSAQTEPVCVWSGRPAFRLAGVSKFTQVILGTTSERMKSRSII